MKKFFFSSLGVFCIIYASAQVVPDGYGTTIIGKDVKDYELKLDITTPFNSYLTREYLMYSGKALWESISTYEFEGLFSSEDEEVSAEKKERVLNTHILEMIIYKDSSGCIITVPPGSSDYYMNYVRLENKGWVNRGQDVMGDLEKVRETILTRLPGMVANLEWYNKLQNVPTDSKPFVDYLKEYSMTPKDFLLKSLSENRIVIYGEVHMRKISWDLMKDVINDPAFADITGTIFMEQPSCMQEVMDQFLQNEKMDTELVLQVLREGNVQGWADRGEFEFLCDLWKVNERLPTDKKIKIILADYQFPLSKIKTKEEYDAYPDVNRNTHMANIVENFVRTKKDDRNSLFLVGYGHAWKTEIPGGYSGPDNALTAGAQLVKRFSGKDVFIITQHAPVIHNRRGGIGLVRHGFFDHVFEEAGNKPSGFILANSPFGKEPFDASAETKYNAKSGTYADNFDGYLFLQPLKEEDSNYTLYDLYSDDFVEEIKRRAAYLGWNRLWRMDTQDLTAEKIKEILRGHNEGKKRFAHLFD